MMMKLKPNDYRMRWQFGIWALEGVATFRVRTSPIGKGIFPQELLRKQTAEIAHARVGETLQTAHHLIQRTEQIYKKLLNYKINYKNLMVFS